MARVAKKMDTSTKNLEPLKKKQNLVPLKENTPKEKRQTERKVERAKKELGWETKKEKEKKAKQAAKAAKKAVKKLKRSLEPIKKNKTSKSNKMTADTVKAIAKEIDSTSGSIRLPTATAAKKKSASITPRTSLTENRYNASKPSNKLVPIPEYSASEQRQRDRKIKRAKKELGWD